MLKNLPNFLLYEMYDKLNNELMREGIYTILKICSVKPTIYVELGYEEAAFYITQEMQFQLISVPKAYRRPFYRIAHKLHDMPEKVFKKELTRFMPAPGHPNIGEWGFKILSENRGVLCRAKYYIEYATTITIRIIFKCDNKPFQKISKFYFWTKDGGSSFLNLNRELNIITERDMEKSRRWINKQIARRDYFRNKYREKHIRKGEISFSPELSVYL